MATFHRLAREQCEKAFAAYLIHQKSLPILVAPVPCPLAVPVDVNILIRKGEINADGEYVLDKPDEIPLPAVCVAVPQMKPHPGMGYPICELHIMILNGIDEEEVNERQSARLGFISELLDESHQSELFSALNGPAMAFSVPTPLPTYSDGANFYSYDFDFGGYLTGPLDSADYWIITVSPVSTSVSGNEEAIFIHQLDGGANTESIRNYERVDGDWTLMSESGALTDVPPVIQFAYSFFYPDDNRTVKNFKVFGMYLTDDMGKETGRHWIDHLVYEVHCQPTDDVNSDGDD